jgi:hypothetical protein
MYPFPPIEELQCFVGDAIAQIWLDPWAVQFTFESRRRLVAGQRIEQIEPDGTLWTYDCKAADGAPIVLQRLLYRPIVGVEREDLRLSFQIDNGSTLTVVSELGPYESGHIETAERDIIVF